MLSLIFCGLSIILMIGNKMDYALWAILVAIYIEIATVYLPTERK